MNVTSSQERYCLKRSSGGIHWAQR